MVEDRKSARNSLIPPSTGTFSGRKSLEFKMSNQDTYLQHHSIHHQQFRFLEEDEIAEVQEIFNHFDLAGRGRVTTDQLTQILHLLSHNIGKVEEKTLMYQIDKKGRGYFTMPDLVRLLNETGFQEDTQPDLLKALQELDDDADGFVEKEALA